MYINRVNGGKWLRYILLLRGVNVGGKNKVSMSELKNMLLASGFEGYRTKSVDD